MNEIQKSSLYAIVAVLLVCFAWATRPRITSGPELAQEQGEPLCPSLADPSTPKAIEIFEFDDDTGAVKPLRVHVKNNRWSIPSHNDYPADAEDRLYKTAGAVIGLRKDSFVSGNKEEHVELGVVDPQQEGSATRGWGTRLTLYDEADNKVADLIFGKSIDGKPGFRYVRLAGEDRVYAVKCDDVDLSTRFTDWIDTDLLKVSSFDLEKLELKDYEVDFRRRAIQDRGTLVLLKDADSNWKLEGLKENEETNTSKASELSSELSNLKIVGVRPKPPGLTADLQTIEGQFLAESMINRGFYITQSGLYSNDGEAVVHTKDGLVYTLRFGGAFLAQGEELTAGTKDEKVKETAKEPPGAKAKKDEKSKDKEPSKDTPAGSSVQEHRFVLVSVSFDESKFPPIPDPPAAAEKPGEGSKDAKAKEEPKAEKPVAGKAEEKKADDAKTDAKAEEETQKKAEAERKTQEEEVKRKREERDKKIADGKKKAKELADRHVNWYYVITNDAFKKIDMTRSDLAKEKEKKEDDKKAESPVTPVPPMEKDAKTADETGKAAKTPAKETPAKEVPAKKDAKEAPAKKDSTKPAPAKEAPGKEAPAKASPQAKPASESPPAKDSKPSVSKEAKSAAEKPAGTAKETKPETAKPAPPAKEASKAETTKKAS